MSDISFTRYPFIGNIDRLESATLPWPAFVAEFSSHVEVRDKMQAPAFGPYVLQTTKEPCRAHKDGKIRASVHRCDECVKEMTLAVFDVDTGTQEEIEKCEARLEKDHISRLWYSSYSYEPGQERPSMRLVLPFYCPLDPREWQSVRAALIYQYAIPCLISACKGKSHLYFTPSCKLNGTHIAFHANGSFLDHRTLPKVFENRATSRYVSLSGWEPPEEPEPGTAVDTAPLKKVIAQRRNYFNKGAPERKYKALLLTRLLEGVALETKGKRNDAMSVVAGIVAYALHKQPVSVLLALVRPSLIAMQNEGSSLTEETVRRMLLSAMRKKAEADAAVTKFNVDVESAFTSFKSSIPEVA